jgi:predicted MFS family arabinose efflux permease
MMMAGLGTGALIMPSVAQYLISKFGWRVAFGGFGAAILLVKVPIVATFLRERPEPMGLLPDGDLYAAKATQKELSDPGLPLKEALRTPIFWLLFCTFFLVSASAQASYTHIAAILADRGTVARTAAFAMSIFGGGVLAGRAGSGYLLDRFFAPRVAAAIFSCAAVGISLLRVSGSMKLAFIAAILIGLGVGAEGDIMAYLAGRYFGLRSFGAIYGFTFSGFVLGGGCGVYLMDFTFDVTGSYAIALTSFTILTLVGAGLMMRLGPYRYQKRALDAHSPDLAQILEPGL